MYPYKGILIFLAFERRNWCNFQVSANADLSKLLILKKSSLTKKRERVKYKINAYMEDDSVRCFQDSGAWNVKTLKPAMLSTKV